MAGTLRADALPPFDDYRTRIQQSFSPATIWEMPWETLSDFPITPDSRLGDDQIVFPPHWMPAGQSRQISSRRLDVLNFLPPNIGRQRCAYHEQSLRRILLALWMVPRSLTTGIKTYKPNSYINKGRCLIYMVRWTLENRFSEGNLFRHLSLFDISEMGGNLEAVRVASVNRDLMHYFARGIIHDAPVISPPTQLKQRPEASRKHITFPNGKDKEEGRWQPFSDLFVTEFGRRILWLVRELGPPLLECYRLIHDTSQWTVISQSAILARRQRIMREFVWRDTSGKVIDALPFPIKLRDDGTKTIDVQYWPPKNWPALAQMVTFLQCAHYNVLGLTIGARWSEVGSARLDCILEDESRFESSTFKLASNFHGESRTWPLCSDALSAVRQQQVLARIVGGDRVEVLWVMFRDNKGKERGDPANVMNENNVRFIHDLGLHGMLGGDRPHTHRWRKTIARLAALALIDSPRVLMDLFGHKNIEMTLRYIFSNADIRAEIEDAAKAAAYALTEEMLDEAEFAGGLAAPKVAQGLEDFRVRLGKEELGTEDVAEAIEIYSLGGSPFQLVRPGIFCTKRPGQFGPCTQRRGAPNPAACSSTCDHRFESMLGKANATEMIPYLIAKIEDPAIADFELTLAALKGQLLTQLSRFDDVREHWIRDSSTARDVWNDDKSGDRMWERG